MVEFIVDGIPTEMPAEFVASLPAAPPPPLDTSDQTFQEEPQWQSLIVSP